MTQVLTPTDRGIKDFTEHVDVRFTIDDDVFIGVPNVPALDLLKFASAFDGLTEQDMLERPEAYEAMLELVLETASAMRFYARMSDKTKPISMAQLMNVMSWLMEEYGMRPTLPSSDSSSGSVNPGDGKSSTASQSPLGLTSSDYPPRAS